MNVPRVDWLARWALYTPNRLFLRNHGDGREWTYREAERRARALAAHLSGACGLRRGDRIAVYAHNCPEYLFLFLACVKLGTVLVPLNFRLVPRELDVLLRDAEPALLVHGDDLARPAAQLTALPAAARRLAVSTLSPLLDGDGDGDGDARFAAAAPGGLDDLVMILYTAGTTGIPKGAMIDHRMLLWNSINTTLRLDLTSQDHTQAYAPLFHTGGWNVLFTPFLHAGASHTLLPGFDADLILELMERERTTIFWGVPAMMQMLVDSPRWAGADLSSVRYAVVGGAPMPVPLINVWHERGVFIRQGYGLTEVGPNCFSLHQDDAVAKRGSIGFPNFYVDARIVGDDGRDCGPDEAGELWLRSPVVTPGYWRRPDETAAAITDGWFHTGDVVRRDGEGFHYVVDRKKNMYISGGENVYPAEVEGVLVTHPAVREAAVVGVPDAKWGEVGKAYVVLEEGRTAGAEEILSHCRDRLAKYKIPRHVEFIAALPRNEAGKVDRSGLVAGSNPNAKGTRS